MDKRRREYLQKVMGKNLSCYVLITCEEPSENGEMPIEMVYHGEESLVSYLLQGAQSHIDQDKEEIEYCSSTANIRLVK